MSREALPCIVCKKPLRNIDEGADNQPYGGTEFTTIGHYGSTIHDEVFAEGDGQPLELVLNVCDTCILRAIDANVIQSQTATWVQRGQAMRNALQYIADGGKHAAGYAAECLNDIRRMGHGIVLSHHPLSDEERAWVLAQNEKEYGSAWGDDQPVDYDALMIEAGWTAGVDEFDAPHSS